jgi:2-polyprenyl-3-methyl-5-hydroxy-6-metoxy-1,4-benzoquinol methylase
MPLLSSIAAKRKCQFFLDRIPKQDRILEIGCGSQWVGNYLRSSGWKNYIGLDIVPPADIVGDVKKWRSLGLPENGFDVIVAFEVVEHVHCFQECFDLLRPGGLLMLTSPVPERDWVLKILEGIGLNQKRTSPHDWLIDFRNIPLFELSEYKRVGGLAQWGVLRKPA